MQRSYKHVYDTAPNSFVCNRLQPSYKRIFDLLGIKDGAQKMKLVKMMAECTVGNRTLIVSLSSAAAMFACAFIRPCATALLCRVLRLSANYIESICAGCVCERTSQEYPHMRAPPRRLKNSSCVLVDDINPKNTAASRARKIYLNT